MTNEVEGLILDKYGKKGEINYSKQVAYKFYEIIWRYILSNDRYDYSYINIDFKVELYDGEYYVCKNSGVKYKVVGDRYEFRNLTYFKGYDPIYIDNVLNTNIDFDLFLDLITSDDFVYSLSRDNEVIWVNIVIKKDIIEKVIDSILTKNKVLKREK